MSNTNTGGSTFPLFGILGIVFIVLKLVGTIDWSWWWVTAPFWGPFAFALPFVILAAVLAAKAEKKVRAFASNDPFNHPFFKN